MPFHQAAFRTIEFPDWHCLVNDQLPNSKLPFGLVVTCTVMGLAASFSIVEVRASLTGYGWLSPRWIGPSIAAISSGSLIGFLVGVVLDRTVLSPDLRTWLLRKLWILMMVGLVLYSLIAPAFDRARD